MLLKNKNIILTGASGGIGKVIAQKCDKEGANLFLISRSENKLKQLLKSLNNISERSTFFAIDISDEESVLEVVNEISQMCNGDIDCLINNAGVQLPIGEFKDNLLSEWKQNLKINLFGAVNMTHAVLPYMVSNNCGRVINISGGGSTGPRVNFSSYGVSKTAIVRFTETIAHELEKYSVYVNAISPGAINTRMLDEVLASGQEAGIEFSSASNRKKKGGDDPQITAELITFLISDASSGITGKLISAIWDPWRSNEFQEQLVTSRDIATLRRIDNKYFYKK